MAGMAIGRDSIFFNVSSTNQAVAAIPIGGGAVSVIFTAPQHASAVAVDSTYVYWADFVSVAGDGPRSRSG
jgi:hypothetical protein